MKNFLFLMGCCIFLVTGFGQNATAADFEDLVLSPESYWNGSDASGGFVSDEVAFSNNYDSTYDSWDGFAYSNMTDTTAQGYTAQYNAITGSGKGGSDIYAIGYVSAIAANPPTITLSSAQVVSGAYFSNNNYAYYSMTNGDDFSKKFTKDDWFKLTITGLDAQGQETGTAELLLANGTDIVNTWQWVDLTGLGVVKQLTFDLSSSDIGQYGINTPTYFVMDNFNEKDVSGSNPDNINENDGNDSSSCFIRSITPVSIFR